MKLSALAPEPLTRLLFTTMNSTFPTCWSVSVLPFIVTLLAPGLVPTVSDRPTPPIFQFCAAESVRSVLTDKFTLAAVVPDPNAIPPEPRVNELPPMDTALLGPTPDVFDWLLIPVSCRPTRSLLVLRLSVL